MGSALIPFGADDDLLFTGLDATEYFLSNTSGTIFGEPLDQRSIILNSTSVTAPGVLGIDDTDGYAHADLDDFDTALRAAITERGGTVSDSPYYVSIKARQSAAYLLPESVESLTRMALIFTQRQTVPSFRSVAWVSAYDPTGTPAGSYGSFQAPSKTAWVRNIVNTSTAFVNVAALREQLAARLTTAYVIPASPTGTFDVAYLALLLEWADGGGRTPPLRQMQRGDGLGSSVPRAVQNNSRQASLRSGRAFI